MNEDVYENLDELSERLDLIEAQIDMIMLEIARTNQVMQSFLELFGHKPKTQLAPVYDINPKGE